MTATMLDSLGRFLGSIVLLPFRLVAWIVRMSGRMLGLILGFILMVIGVALWAGPLLIFGIPLFLLGLLLTIRCLS